MPKAYVKCLEQVPEKERYNVHFCSSVTDSHTWRSLENVQVECDELNRGVTIQSTDKTMRVVCGFNVEEAPQGGFVLWCDLPFIPTGSRESE